MKPSLLIRLLAAALLVGSAFAFSGCSSTPERSSDSSQLPWARPANWEGGMPGAGGFGQQGRGSAF